jgi:predicted secreted protein
MSWRQLLDAGVRSMELTGSGIFNDDASMDIFLEDLLNGAIKECKLISGRGDSFAGLFLLGGGERSGEYNGAEQYTMSFASADEITHTPAT